MSTAVDTMHQRDSRITFKSFHSQIFFFIFFHLLLWLKIHLSTPAPNAFSCEQVKSVNYKIQINGEHCDKGQRRQDYADANELHYKPPNASPWPLASLQLCLPAARVSELFVWKQLPAAAELMLRELCEPTKTVKLLAGKLNNEMKAMNLGKAEGIQVIIFCRYLIVTLFYTLSFDTLLS